MALPQFSSYVCHYHGAAPRHVFLAHVAAIANVFVVRFFIWLHVLGTMTLEPMDKPLSRIWISRQLSITSCKASLRPAKKTVSNIEAPSSLCMIAS